MKKFIILLVASLMLSTLNVFAEEQKPCFVSTDYTVNSGEEVKVKVEIKNNPGIISLRCYVTFDEDLLQMVSFEDTGLLAGNTPSQVTVSPLTLKWTDALSMENHVVNGEIGVLTFKAKKFNAKTPIIIEFVESRTFDGEIIPFDNATVNIEIKNGEEIGTVTDIDDEEEIIDNNNVNSGSSSSSTSKSHSGSLSSSSTNKGVTSTVTESNQDILNLDKQQIVLTIGKTDAVVFGETKSNDVAPLIKNDRTMLPARFVAESLGATVAWIEAEQKVTITKDDITIVIYIDSEKAYVNDKEVTLDSPAFIENDRTYTPLRFVAENLGATVDWIESELKVVITRK
ncbi:MAG: copper amine oxidase N-terminal domain-containing protein [Clostridiaceae bacterium]|jgi:hypothetical protein|nr:copper amine oxidase N-terminal domain-containing protein [Clostridiaceae bacterium]